MAFVRNAGLIFLLTWTSNSLYAWGERGHDSIARLAARILAQDSDPELAAWGRLLVSKEHMLGHLANVPDIVWRRAGPELDQLNSPSHFIDLEYILAEGKLKEGQELPKTIDDYKKRILSNCDRKGMPCAPGSSLGEKMAKAGHAPFRVQFLTKDLISDLEQLKSESSTQKKNEEERIEIVNRALLHAGVLAHFVGDLANPHHTSVDYDGWLGNQGGLHKYFESEMVDAQDLGLDLDIFREAMRHHPSDALFVTSKEDALDMAWALVRDSHAKVGALMELDRRHSLLKPSQNSQDEQVKRTLAQRKAPESIADTYRDLIALRLAMGADALARFWKLAYVKGGKPNLSFYRSYAYPVEPAFIPLGYDVSAMPK